MAAMIQPVSAADAQEGHFYRTPGGRLVKVREFSKSRQVRIEYWGRYGLGWRTMWLPGDTTMTPAPEFTAFPEPEESESVLFGVTEPESVPAD